MGNLVSGFRSKLGNASCNCLSCAEMKRFWLAAAILILAIAGCRKQTTPDSPTLPVVENKTGVSLYPKSSEWGPGNSAGDGSGSNATARQSDDAPEQVIEFYKKELRDTKVSSDNLGDIIHITLTGKTKDGATAEVVVMKLPQQKTQIFVSARR